VKGGIGGMKKGKQIQIEQRDTLRQNQNDANLIAARDKKGRATMATCTSRSRRKTTTMVASNMRRTALLMLLVTAACADPSVAHHERRSLTKTGSNINETYEHNSEGHTLRTALFGCLAAVGTLAGLLFLVDKDVSAHDVHQSVTCFKKLCNVRRCLTHPLYPTTALEQNMQMHKQMCINQMRTNQMQSILHQTSKTRCGKRLGRRRKRPICQLSIRQKDNRDQSNKH
jgi:hypothetical protein